MKRIAVFQSELDVGGIQKSLVNLLGALDYERVSVDLYLSEEKNFWGEKLPPNVRVKVLPETPKAYSFLPFDLVKSLLHYDFSDCGEYDLAIDFNSYQCSCAVGALSVPAKRRVMWIHNNVAIKLDNEWKYRVLWHFFRGKFKYYDGFVPVSQALIEPFREKSGVSGKPFTVIANVIDAEEIRAKMEQHPVDLCVDGSFLNLVALGKLCRQKGYDIMLDAFAKAVEKRDDLRLYIIGDGPDRATLEQQRDKLGLSDRVFFLGNKTNPYCYMARLDAFISTSRYEGQPLNIMEAMAVGLPLYCTKNLEAYTEGLRGCEDIAAALVYAKKEPKHPDGLEEYNRRILDSIYRLAEG